MYLLSLLSKRFLLFSAILLVFLAPLAGYALSVVTGSHEKVPTTKPATRNQQDVEAVIKKKIVEIDPEYTGFKLLSMSKRGDWWYLLTVDTVKSKNSKMIVGDFFTSINELVIVTMPGTPITGTSLAVEGVPYDLIEEIKDGSPRNE